MTATRRTVLLATPALLLAAGPLRAQAPADPRMGDRADGKPDAKVTIQEWYSMTCPHCARFARDVYPRVKSELIDTGKIRYIWKDYPLDSVALLAAAVARSLPPERYEPFVMTLFATQDRWAFDRTVDQTEELAKMAALAGMPRSAFDRVANDDALKTAILTEQKRGEDKYKIDATPTFVNGTKTKSGELTFDEFKAFALS